MPLHSVCETSFSTGSLRSICLEIIGEGKSNEQTTSFLSLLCIAVSLPVYKSFLLPSSFSSVWGGGGMDFQFFSSSFSLLSGLLLLSVLGLPLIFQPQFLYLPLLVEKTLSLLGSFSFFFFFKVYILNSFWLCAKHYKKGNFFIQNCRLCVTSKNIQSVVNPSHDFYNHPHDS